MFCNESLKLENAYRLRYDRAQNMEHGGPRIVSTGNNSNHSFLLRQYRTQQTQAANAILMHQKHCPVCNHQQTTPAAVPESLAS
jgi:hypothetical protein